MDKKVRTERKIHGTLSTKTVELPPKSEAHRLEMEETNRQIAGLGRVYRGGTDWVFQEYGDKEPVRFQSGDLVKIFKTVTEGDPYWIGTVKLDRSDYHHGLQEGMDKEKWSSMFFKEMPVKLERDGKVIFGAMEPFCETGTEGVIWSVREYGKSGYDGLVTLKDGDKLTVYANVRDGEVEWEGELDFGPDEITKHGWTEVVREPKHMKTEDWLQLCWESRPAIIVPKL